MHLDNIPGTPYFHSVWGMLIRSRYVHKFLSNTAYKLKVRFNRLPWRVTTPWVYVYPVIMVWSCCFVVSHYIQQVVKRVCVFWVATPPCYQLNREGNMIFSFPCSPLKNQLFGIATYHPSYTDRREHVRRKKCRLCVWSLHNYLIM